MVRILAGIGKRRGQEKGREAVRRKGERQAEEGAPSASPRKDEALPCWALHLSVTHFCSGVGVGVGRIRWTTSNKTSFFSCLVLMRFLAQSWVEALGTRGRPALGLRQRGPGSSCAGCWPRAEALGALTDPAGRADADDRDVGAVGVVKQLDKLVQHDRGGGDAYAVLQQGETPAGRQGGGARRPLHRSDCRQRRGLPSRNFKTMNTLGDAQVCAKPSQLGSRWLPREAPRGSSGVLPLSGTEHRLCTPACSGRSLAMPPA